MASLSLLSVILALFWTLKLTFMEHINSLCFSCLYHPHQLRVIQCTLDLPSTSTLIHTFICFSLNSTVVHIFIFRGCDLVGSLFGNQDIARHDDISECVWCLIYIACLILPK